MLRCESLIESLSASHSTYLQQRAYELQAFIGLDSNAIHNIMPFDASCEDIEVIVFCIQTFAYLDIILRVNLIIFVFVFMQIDKSLSFLNGYVQKSLEEGA